MNKLSIILITGLLITNAFAQAPEKMSYQAVIRNADGNTVTTTVGMQISILQGSAQGSAVYAETQTPLPNASGLVSLEIGTGTVVTGSFAAIDWASGPYFIKTETDVEGGTNYTISGTSQLLSVPYALHAETVANITIDGDDEVFNTWDKDATDDFDGNYSNLIDAPTIPEKVSDLTNDAGYITSSQNLATMLSEGNNADGNSILNLNQVAIGTASPNSNAALDISSTTGALLMPRMTTAQRDELTPVEGMAIYNTDLGKFQGYAKSASSSSSALLENTVINDYKFPVGRDYLYTGQTFQFDEDIAVESVTVYASTITEAGEFRIEIVDIGASSLSCDGISTLGSGTVNVTEPGEVKVTFASPILCPTGKQYAFKILPVVSTAYISLDCNNTQPPPVSSSRHIYFYSTSPRCNQSSSDLRFTITGTNISPQWTDFH